MSKDPNGVERRVSSSPEPPTKALTLRLVTGLRSEEEVHELFRFRLQPWLDQLPLDTTIVDIDDTDAEEQIERLAADPDHLGSSASPARVASRILCETSDDGDPLPFVEALISFKVAAANLNAAWPDGRRVGHYPDYLPTFDEFVADFSAVETWEGQDPR